MENDDDSALYGLAWVAVDCVLSVALIIIISSKEKSA